MVAKRRSMWDKVMWTWQPETYRQAGDSIVRNFLLHWFPAKVTTASLSWGYSFWLGTISAVRFLAHLNGRSAALVVVGRKRGTELEDVAGRDVGEGSLAVVVRRR